MRERNMDQYDAIAKIALDIPEKPTTADVLRALTRAYDAGKRSALSGLRASTIAAREADDLHLEALYRMAYDV